MEQVAEAGGIWKRCGLEESDATKVKSAPSNGGLLFAGFYISLQEAPLGGCWKVKPKYGSYP